MKTLNYKKVFDTLIEETKKYLLDNNLKAMILGISGGIDSTVTAAICHEVSKQTGIPLIGRSLPIKNKDDEFDTSKLVGEVFCNDFEVCGLGLVYDKLKECITGFEYNTLTNIADGNIQARLRMIYLYNLASIHNGLVLSTDNQTEYQLGFWTLHGDVGDFDPLQDLWKTEVYGLADWIKIKYMALNETDKAIAIGKSIELTPTDGLGISNSDLDQIGAKSYNDVDTILQDYIAYCQIREFSNEELSIKCYLEDNALYDIEPDVIKKVLERHLKSEFKRKKAPIYIPRNKYERDNN